MGDRRVSWHLGRVRQISLKDLYFESMDRPHEILLPRGVARMVADQGRLKFYDEDGEEMKK